MAQFLGDPAAKYLRGLPGSHEPGYIPRPRKIPRHARLEKGGKQEVVIRELVLYNWPRTLAITGSALLTLLMLNAAFAPV